MRFGQIDIPEEILDAQEDGNLVIFVGAGISRDEPSELPDFELLAKQIGENTGMPYDNKSEEPFDQYLGRLNKIKIDALKDDKSQETLDQLPDLLEKAKIFIHIQAKQILTQGDPQPNDYHLMIPRLFPNATKLRIVTTNQDMLIHLSAGKHWKDLPIYEAPALPLGNDFSGLVSLHGNVRQEPGRMVLTDSDFSRAYLTEGWARRFLLKL